MYGVEGVTIGMPMMPNMLHFLVYDIVVEPIGDQMNEKWEMQPIDQ